MSYIDGSESPPKYSLYFQKQGESYVPISEELSVRYWEKLSDFERASKKALGALKSIISLENQERFRDKSSARELFEAIKSIYDTKGLELISRYINKIVDNSYSSYKNIDEYTSAIQSSAIYLKQLNCPLPKPIIASLIFKGLPSSFDSFSSRKYEEISNNLEDINLESLINDLISEEARMGANADYRANKAQANKAFTKSGGKYCTHCKLSGHISEKCFKLHPELRPQNQKAKKARESKNNSSKTLMSAWNNDSFIASQKANIAKNTLIKSNSYILSQTSIDYKDQFVLDSGATEHYSPNRDWLVNYKPISNKSIRIANGENMPILGIGDIPIQANGLSLTIKGVNYIPGLATTLISSKELTNKNWSIQFSQELAQLSHPDISKPIRVKWEEKAYFIQIRLDNSYIEQTLFQVQAPSPNDITLYHKRLIHINQELILKTIENSFGLKKIQPTNRDLEHCESCISAKITEKGSKKPTSDSPPLTIFDIDIAGPFTTIDSRESGDEESNDQESYDQQLNNQSLAKSRTRGKAKDYSNLSPNVTTRAMTKKSQQPNIQGSSSNEPNLPGMFPDENSSNLAIELNNRLINEDIQALSVYKTATHLASLAFISYKATDNNPTL
ncbi:retrotransposon protein, putative, Ty1-copia subclass, partial [Diplocarpon rosae]